VPLRHHQLADGDPLPGEQVQLAAVLHQPAGGGQLGVDAHAGALLGRQPLVVHRPPVRPQESAGY
jgi:hypothetical protein